MIKKLSRCKFVRNFILAIILSVGAASFVNAKNSITKVNMKEAATIASSLIKNKNLLCVEFDAKDWKDDEDFFEDIGRKIKFPQSRWNYESWCLDEFEDLMRDLIWTGDKSIVIIIKNLSKFNRNDSEVERHILTECFENVILPFWEGKPGTHSVVDCYPCMKPKKFNVYYT